MRLLLDRGVDLTNTCDRHGYSAIHLALDVGRECETSLLRALVGEAGVDIDAIDAFGDTPCHVAVACEHVDGLRTLIELGAIVDAVNDDSNTPLLEACAGTSDRLHQCALLLLAAGADPSFKNRAGELVSDLTVSRATLCALIAAGAKVNDEDNKVPPSADELATMRRKIAALRLDFVRHRARDVCIGLHARNIDALQMCEILQFACGPVARLIPFHQWWRIATTVKHKFTAATDA